MSDSAEYKLLLVDDHPFVREGIRSFISEVPGMVVVGEAGSGEEALELTRTLSPDLILLDINLPGINGLEAVRRLRKLAPRSRILILTVHQSREYVLHVAKSGAHGYILKESAPSELLQAIRAIQSGQRYYSPSIAGHIIDDYQSARDPKGEQSLAPSEFEVLILTARGKSMKEIADEMDVSLGTVQTYRSRLMEKLGINNLAGLIKYALQKGIVQ